MQIFANKNHQPHINEDKQITQSQEYISEIFNQIFPQPSSDQKQGLIVRIYYLYLYKGSCWKLIQSQLKGGIKNPKNFIYNSIRKSVKILADYQTKVLGKKRRNISKDTILSMLQIVNQAIKEVEIRNLTINEDSHLFRFKKSFLRFTLWENSLNEEEILDLFKLIRQINHKLRSLSIFKSKSRRNWRISSKALALILSFDKLSNEENFQIKGEIKGSQEYLDKVEQNSQREQDNFRSDLDHLYLNTSLSIPFNAENWLLSEIVDGESKKFQLTNNENEFFYSQI